MGTKGYVRLLRARAPESRGGQIGKARAEREEGGGALDEPF